MPTNNNPANPFPAVPVCIYSEGPIPTLPLESTLASREALKQYLSDEVGRTIPVSGRRGCGKTHLLAALAQETLKARKDTTCLYARGDWDSSQIYKQLVRRISKDRLFQLIDIAARNTAGNDQPDRWVALRAAVGRDLDPALENSFRSSDPDKAEEAYRWLMGDVVPNFGELDVSRQSNILRMIAAIHRSARLYSGRELQRRPTSMHAATLSVLLSNFFNVL